MNQVNNLVLSISAILAPPDHARRESEALTCVHTVSKSCKISFQRNLALHKYHYLNKSYMNMICCSDAHILPNIG